MTLDHVPQPLIITFRELRDATRLLHLGNKAWVDELHDIWKRCAPTPDSIIRDPRHYDERLRQAGNVEKRIVVPEHLAAWIMKVSARRGFPYDYHQALQLLDGKIDYNFGKVGVVRE